MKLIGFSVHSILEFESIKESLLHLGCYKPPFCGIKEMLFWKTILDKVTPKLETLPKLL